MILEKKIPGKAIPKGRPRFWEGKVITPASTRKYEEYIKEQCKDFQKLEGPIIMIVEIAIETPKCRKEQVKQPLGRYVQTRPDIDNYIKIFMDALNGIAYDDDSQVSYVCGVKKYVDEPSYASIYITNNEYVYEQLITVNEIVKLMEHQNFKFK